MDAIRFEIVGFDLDGTLLDTSADLGAAVNHALGLIGRAPVSPADVRALIGGGAATMLNRALALTGGDDGVEVPALFDELLAYYDAHIAVHTAPYPGTLAALDTLTAQGVRLAVVTNKAEAMTCKLLDTLELTARFDCVIGRGATGIAAPKPAPDSLLAMQARLGGGAAAYVGDSSFDTRAAKAAGFPCVAVSFGFNDLPVDALGADAVIDHYDDLVTTLRHL